MNLEVLQAAAACNSHSIGSETDASCNPWMYPVGSRLLIVQLKRDRHVSCADSVLQLLQAC